MGDFHITSLTDVSCPIVLHPDWSFRNRERLIRSEHRTQQGKGFVYHWGGFFAFEIPVGFVDSGGQSRLNTWWKNLDELAFTLNTSAALSTVLCRITNKSQPLDRFTRPYDDLYAGTLELESLDGSAKTRQPFILDDQGLGLLDKDYNALIK